MLRDDYSRFSLPNIIWKTVRASILKWSSTITKMLPFHDIGVLTYNHQSLSRLFSTCQTARYSNHHHKSPSHLEVIAHTAAVVMTSSGSQISVIFKPDPIIQAQTFSDISDNNDNLEHPCNIIVIHP